MSISPLIEEKYRAADRALKQSDPSRAAQLLLELVDIEPNEPLFHWRLGYVLSEMREFPRAIVEFHRALKLDSQNVAALGGLGRVYIDLRLWNLAEEAIQHRLNLKESAQYYVFLAYIMLQTKRYEKAAESCLRAIGLDPNFSEAYYNLGLAFRYREQVDEAITAFKKAVELDDHYPDGFRELGLSYFGSGKLDQAKEALETCLTMNPTDAWAHFYLALCSEYLGDLNMAEAHFEAARQVDPREPIIEEKFKEYVRRKIAPTKSKRSPDKEQNE